MKDKSPVHTARAVQQWFQRQSNIELLDWLRKGADMNVIEHIWAQMVNTWDMEYERSTIDLMTHVRRQWEFFRGRPKQMETLVASMPTRLQAVIDREGGWTRY